MARMIPEGPLPQSVALAGLHRALRRALDDNHVVYQRFGDAQPAADFWIRHISGRSLFVCLASRLGSHPKENPEAETTHRVFNRDDLRALLAFQAELLPGERRPRLQEAAPLLIILSGASDVAVQKTLSQRGDFPLLLAGRECLDPRRLEALVEQNLGRPVTPPILARFRHCFSPEALVPAPLNPHPPAELAYGAVATGWLDHHQERALKHDIGQGITAHGAGDIPHLRLLNGVAGSGKSLILLYRVRLLRQLYPRQRVLALVHSKPVAQDLQARYRRISDGDTGPEWLTFYQWCRQFVPGYLDFASETLEREVASDIIRVHLQDTRLSPAMLLDEIHFYKDRLLFSLQDYLNVDRGGQGFRLSEGMRKRVFVAMRAFDQRLNSMRKASWHDLPRLAWERIDRGVAELPCYSHILVDEAQFFAPLWFELLKRAVEPQQGHLWMAADPSQGFLRRRRSWLSAGIEVRGRTTRLRKSYRTTQAIMTAATEFMRRRDALELCEEGGPTRVENTIKGDPPRVHSFMSESAEWDWLCEEIVELQAQGVTAENILIAPASQASVRQIGNAINRRLGGQASNILQEHGRVSTCARGVQICNLKSVSGLEAQYVYLVGLQRLFEREGEIHLCSEEREQHLAEHTRQIYTGMTRAATQLTLSVVGRIPACLHGIAEAPALASGSTAELV